MDSQLEIPNRERLLPIGQYNKDVSQLVDKVKQGLGLNAQQVKISDNKKIENGRDLHSQTQSPRRLIKQVALESPTQGDFDDSPVFKNTNMDNKSIFLANTSVVHASLTIFICFLAVKKNQPPTIRMQ